MKAWSTRVRAALPWIAAVLFLVAAWNVWRTFRSHGREAVADALAALEPATLALAALFAAASYVTLTFFDYLAVRAVARAPLAYPKVALTSFTALALGHTVGLAALSSGTVRYRFYSHFGLGEGDVARIVLFCAGTVAVGLAGVAGFAALAQPHAVARLAGLDVALVVAAGVVAWLALAGYVLVTARAGGSVRFRGREQPVPSWRMALLQIAVGCLNYVFVAALLHRLVAGESELSFAAFAALYTVANVLAIASHVPGGFGVLEFVVLSAVPGAESLGALLVFRILYNLVPFLLGAGAYGLFELARRGRGRRRRGTA